MNNTRRTAEFKASFVSVFFIGENLLPEEMAPRGLISYQGELRGMLHYQVKF